jgi:hypothetical protein
MKNLSADVFDIALHVALGDMLSATRSLQHALGDSATFARRHANFERLVALFHMIALFY